ncbi:MAG: HpcH/HpaI aldolase/citrate lyase family protein [Nocardioidaceae bacterium]
MNGAPTTARTWLFVPGDRPERFGKAVHAGPDVVVIDLEDAVRVEAKQAARSHAETWLAQVALWDKVAIRINAPGHAQHQDDVAMVRRTRPAAVMLPKAEVESTRSLVDATRGTRTQVVALVETASGVMQADALCAVPGLARVALGTLDLAAQLGCDPDGDPIRVAASLLVMNSAACGLPGPIDGVCTNLDSDEELRAQTAAARRWGFTGKLAIHPRQVPVIAGELRPTPEQVAWARTVLAHSAGGGVAAVDGRMVDEPVLRKARQIIDSTESEECA